MGATFRHSARIDLSKPPLPEISAARETLRVCMSTKIFSQAMRSVCGVLNTHFLTGSTITTAPASEMNGTPACSASGTAAMVAPVVEPPTMMSTLSCSIRRLAKVRAFSASPPSSYDVSCSLRPSTPPSALMRST